jgi:hypothetical protein
VPAGYAVQVVKRLVIILALALLITLGSGSVPARMTVLYPDIDDCVRGCEVAASGFPIAFIADYPGLSPVNSADPVGALMGVDRILWGRAPLVFGISALLSTAIVAALSRVRTKRPVN